MLSFGLSAGLAGVLSSAFAALLRAVVGGLARAVLVPVATYLLRTPDLLGQPGLRVLWLAGLGCYLALAAALVLVAATASITGWTPPALTLRRLASCSLTAAVALPLLAEESRLANAVVGVFVPVGARLGRAPAIAALLGAAAGSSAAGLALLLVAAVGTVLLATLAVQALLRWALLWALVAGAPLVLAVGLLPGEGPAGLVRLWWRLQAGAALLPAGYAVLFAVDAALFGSARGVTAALAGVGVLALMVRLPGWAAGQLAHPGARDVTGPARRLALDTRLALRRAPLTGSALDAASLREQS